MEKVPIGCYGNKEQELISSPPLLSMSSGNRALSGVVDLVAGQEYDYLALARPTIGMVGSEWRLRARKSLSANT